MLFSFLFLKGIRVMKHYDGYVRFETDAYIAYVSTEQLTTGWFASKSFQYDQILKRHEKLCAHLIIDKNNADVLKFNHNSALAAQFLERQLKSPIGILEWEGIAL